ncbi:TetR/AcrR family transcriptional regulator [Streptomyces sp. NPDC051940]|uniref:TetR/AcrR family transcriptional regulator n=1 Tax=Streptomyces sp. NPDC051940 TaxID=3155675 RepID=UPI003428F2E7
MSAEERRESVIRAAITEFGRAGYDGTSTEAIAKRVGVSQPYLFRLFPNKQAIFMEAALRCLHDTQQVLDEAVEPYGPDQQEEAGLAIAVAYQKLVADRDMLLMQMQIYVAVAKAESAGDHEFGKPIRAAWAQMYDSMLLVFGGDHIRTAEHFSFGMLINVLVALGFPGDHRVWAGFWPESREAIPDPSR